MYTIINRGKSTEILLYDDIGEGWFGGISAKQVRTDLADIKTPIINVRINSPGGSVHEGFAIANALRDHKARVEIDIDALAASIAAYIAVEAADELRMADNAMLMIHNAWSMAVGDADEFRRQADILDKHNALIVSSIAKRTSSPEADVRGWMDAETWFNAEEAQAAGFVDAITEESATAAAWFDPARFRNTPAALKGREKPKDVVDVARELVKQRLRFQ